MYSPRAMRGHLSVMPGKAKARKVPDLDPAYDFKCFERISAERDQHLGRWRDIYRLMMPNRLAFDDSKIPDGKRAKAVDSYPAHALQRGVGNVISALFPPERTWFEIVAGADIKESDAERINEAVERWRDVVFETLSRSNFASELNAMMLDVFVSIGGMIVEPGKSRDDALSIRAVPLSELYPIADTNGAFVGMMRRYECEVAAIESEFGGPGRKLTIPDSLMEKARTDPKHKVTLLECSKTIEGVGQRLTVYAWEGKHVILDHVGRDPEEPSRWVVTGWTKVAGQTYHVGPADRALETTRMLNAVKEDDAKAMRRRIDPPTLVDVDSGINPHTVRFVPHAVIGYSSKLTQGGLPVTPLQDGGNLQYQQIKVAELKAELDEILFSARTLPPVAESHNMTAAEIRVRWMQRLREEGVDFALLNRTFGTAFIQRVVWILRSLGMIPPQLRVNGRTFKIRYAGPLASAQDAEDATNILSFVSDLMATVGPDATADSIRLEDVGSIVGNKRNVPASLMRTEEERVQRQQAKLAMAAAEAKMAAQGAA